MQKQMVFNEKLNKFLEATQKKKPFNYDNVFRENSEFKKQNDLLQVKLKALSMEEKRCRLMVGCSSWHCPKRYWDGL